MFGVAQPKSLWKNPIGFLRREPGRCLLLCQSTENVITWALCAQGCVKILQQKKRRRDQSGPKLKREGDNSTVRGRDRDREREREEMRERARERDSFCNPLTIKPSSRVRQPQCEGWEIKRRPALWWQMGHPWLWAAAPSRMTGPLALCCLLLSAHTLSLTAGKWTRPCLNKVRRG